MKESLKEKDEAFVKETVNLLVKQSNLIESDPHGGYAEPGEYLSDDIRVTVSLTKNDIKSETGRTVVRKDALKNLAAQFEQYGCTAVITKDKLNVTSPVMTSEKKTLDELRDSVNKGMEEFQE